MPDVDLGPVRQRERAHRLAGRELGVDRVPQLRALAARLPPVPRHPQAEDPLLGTAALLVAARPADRRVVAALVEGRAQGDRLHQPRVLLGAVAERGDALGHRLGVRGHAQVQAVLLGHLPAEGDHVAELPRGVHVQHRERDRPRGERLGRQVQHHPGVLADAVEHHGVAERSSRLAQRPDRLSLQRVEDRIRDRPSGRRHSAGSRGHAGILSHPRRLPPPPPDRVGFERVAFVGIRPDHGRRAAHPMRSWGSGAAWTGPDAAPCALWNSSAHWPSTAAGAGSRARSWITTGRWLPIRVRIPTPYPMPPQRFVEVLCQLAEDLPPADRATVGVPGMIRHGRVITTPHYITTGGPHSPVDPDLERAWDHFDAQTALARGLGIPTRVVNDAEVHGAAVVSGEGLEVVFTLGTGLGCAVFDDGSLAPKIELSRSPVRKGVIYDEWIGDLARRELGATRWSRRVRKAVDGLRPMFVWDRLYVGGGNAQRLTLDLGDGRHDRPQRGGHLRGHPPVGAGPRQCQPAGRRPARQPLSPASAPSGSRFGRFNRPNRLPAPAPGAGPTTKVRWWTRPRTPQTRGTPTSRRYRT